MFVVGAVVVGVVVISDDDHSKHSRYVEHSKYGDSEMVRMIHAKQQEIDRKEYNVGEMYDDMKARFDSRVAELQNTNDVHYSALKYPDPNSIVDKVKQEMRNEIENEIRQDKETLAHIDKMISRINEIELQAKGR